MTWNYKNIAVDPQDYDRLKTLANGRPLGKQIKLILDALEAKGMKIEEVLILPHPIDAEEVPLVTVSAGE